MKNHRVIRLWERHREDCDSLRFTLRIAVIIAVIIAVSIVKTNLSRTVVADWLIEATASVNYSFASVSSDSATEAIFEYRFVV